jgi:DNA-binding HxlR family transcriptional regulator
MDGARRRDAAGRSHALQRRVEYELTTRGRTLREPLCALAEWVRKHQSAIEQAQKRFDAEHVDSKNVRHSPRRVPPLALVRRARP